MQTFDDTVFRLSKLAAQVSAVLLVYMVLHILIEIVLRGFFDSSTYVLDEFIGYGVAAITFLALGYAFEEGALIRVNLVLIRTKGAVRRGLEVFCVVATLGVIGYLGWYFWRDWQRAWERGEVSPSIAEIPVWIPLGLVMLGYILFTLQLFAYLVRLSTGGRIIESDETGE